ncbi:hypothetical protein RvY_18755 [Ramazzottius varieornatus]|uniref:Uncharacterized protein n=1 Tax=Ramazzottius varieornatus TaxID=947166 RepID=A0A1D1W8B2_RAMVA|nr:hypothetical protein RvY_18755 [Ramazzottius varieornatus]
MTPGKLIDPDLVAKARVARRIKKIRSWVSEVLRNDDPNTNERKVKKPRGRPRITTPDQDQDILSFVSANRELSGVKIAAELGMNRQTLLNRLHENHIRRSKAILNGLTPSHGKSQTGAVALVRVDGNEDSEKYTEIVFDHLVPYLDK